MVSRGLAKWLAKWLAHQGVILTILFAPLDMIYIHNVYDFGLHGFASMSCLVSGRYVAILMFVCFCAAFLKGSKKYSSHVMEAFFQVRC